MILHLLPFLVGLSSASPLDTRQEGRCTVQSCQIAALAGSTKESFTGTTVPDGTTLNGVCCVTYYNPAVKEIAYDNVDYAREWCTLFPYTPSDAGVSKRDADTEMVLF